ncbi:MAG: hypothetical protein ABW278_10425 [Steroidobacteraceae bacterium]
MSSVLSLVAACAKKEPVAAQDSCAWPDELDAVRAAPESHKVIFENEHVRVLEVMVAPHSKEPIHAHCWPSTVYIQQMGNIIDRNAQGEIIGDTTKLPQKPPVPFAAWGPPEGPHSVENLDELPLKMIRVEQKN